MLVKSTYMIVLSGLHNKIKSSTQKLTILGPKEREFTQTNSLIWSEKIIYTEQKVS